MLGIAFVLGLLIGILVGMSVVIWILEEPKESIYRQCDHQTKRQK